MNFAAGARRFARTLKLATHGSYPIGLILLYHRVATLTPDPWQLCVSLQHFRQHMQWLSENARVLPLAEIEGALQHRQAGLPLVAVTFDDGYADNVHRALPVLKEYRVPATFFLTVPWLSDPREFWWDELERIFLQPSVLPPLLGITRDPALPTWHLGHAARYTVEDANANRQWRACEPPPTLRHAIYGALRESLYGMMPEQRQFVLDEILEWADAEPSERPTHRKMTRDDVLVLSRSSLVEVGAHSVSHAALPGLPPPQRTQEIELSGRALTQLLNRPVTNFAYPHGDYCPETARSVREAGFLRACTTRSGLVQKRQNEFELPRFCVGDWDGNEFARHIASWVS